MITISLAAAQEAETALFVRRTSVTREMRETADEYNRRRCERIIARSLTAEAELRAGIRKHFKEKRT